jgi:AcrR family transcriptional regulator
MGTISTSHNRLAPGQSPARRRGPGARPRRARGYHHGDLRTAALDHVRHIIRERGVGFVSIREVARRSRVSHAAPAHHFGNKSGLLTAFAVQGYEMLAGMMQAELARSGAVTPPDRLAAMGRGYVEFALEHREHFGIMFPDEPLNRDDPDYIRATDHAFRPLLEIVTLASEEGYLAADPLLVAAAAWSLVHGLAALWLSGRLRVRFGAGRADALAAATTRLFVDSVMRRDRPARKSVVSSRRGRVEAGPGGAAASALCATPSLAEAKRRREAPPPRQPK